MYVILIRSNLQFLLLDLHKFIRVPSCIYLLCPGFTCSMLSILHFYSAIFLSCFPILTATTSVWPWLFFIFPISTPICSFINFIGRLLSSCSCLVVELCELFVPESNLLLLLKKKKRIGAVASFSQSNHACVHYHIYQDNPDHHHLLKLKK